MSSVQERLQLKRVPLDTWTIREQLGLASAVVKSGDQNWMSVSRSLKTIGDPTRPADWYSQKSCAAQYGVLLEHVETPKRKKRSSEGAAESPQESILKKLTLDRIAEIQKTVQELTQQYQTIKNEVIEIKNPTTSEERIKELLQAVETENLLKEREAARKANWLREREERRARVERGWRGSDPAQQSTSTPSSPLLSSLLKSSPVVTTPQHISHPANAIETVSPSAGAPTLSMLLEKSSPCHENKHAAIEHIKNQLVQIEQQYIGTSSPQSVPAPPALDIDDIEIKDEDVYAFRDVDIEIAPVQNIHKGNNKPDKPQTNEDEEISIVEDKVEQKDESMEVDTTLSDTSKDESNIETSTQEAIEPEQPPVEEVKISFPEVKFPTTEIKVITPDENVVGAEVKDETEPEQEQNEVNKETVVEEIAPPSVEENVTITETEAEAVPEVEVEQTNEQIEEEKEEIAPVEEIVTATPEAKETAETEPVIEETEPPAELIEEKTEDIKTEVTQDQDNNVPTPQAEEKEADQTQSEEIKRENEENKQEIEIHLDTDDDTPMEVIREEEKEGKQKRDYSRKKKFESRTCSGSESAELSAPDSPSATEQEKQHKLWKKAVLLVYSRLSAHKYASLFLRPITDEQAPGYSIVVKRPMDLSTIKKNIDNGVIRSTVEFQRDVLLMLNNALMYNSSEHRVYQMTKEMYAEAQNEFNVLFAAQAHSGLEPTTRQRRHEASRSRASKRSI